MEKCHDNKNQHWNVTESYNFKSIADGTFSYTVNTKCDHARKNDERADYNLTFCCWNSSEPEEMAQWNAHNQCEPNGNVDQLRRKLSTYDKLREKFYSLFTIIHSRRKIYMRILNENALTFEKCFQKGMEWNWISSEFHYYIIISFSSNEDYQDYILLLKGIKRRVCDMECEIYTITPACL